MGQFFNSFGHQQGHFNTYHYPTAMSSYSSYSAFPGYSAYQPRGFASVASYNPAYGYAAAGRYLADSIGAVHIAKREAEAEAEPEAEAEAEAEPQMSYNSYRYPTVYSGYPRSFYQPSYNNFGYRNFYGK